MSLSHPFFENEKPRRVTHLQSSHSITDIFTFILRLLVDFVSVHKIFHCPVNKELANSMVQSVLGKATVVQLDKEITRFS
jgi:hypothetical protein